MINATLDLIDFLKSNFGFLFALALYTVLAIALSKSIKKREKVYYWIFGVISFCFIIPSVARLTGITLPFNLSNIPFIGLSASELSSAANFIHPVLVIIMFMGALNAKNKYVGRLMSIRKELSIIVGFPVLAHAVKRVFGSFPGGWQYFFDNETYMQSPKVTSALGSGITSFAFVLGLLMTILFLVLWITSFDSVHRKMGSKRWKSVQKWSYGLYAMLFIHSVCLQAGGLISDSARAEQQLAQKGANIEVVEMRDGHGSEQKGGQAQAQQGGHGSEQKGGQAQAQQSGKGSQQQGGQAQAQQSGKGSQQQGGQAQAQQGGHGHGNRSFTFSSIEIERSTKRWINIFIYIAVYGSYLYLRVRKAKAKARRKSANKAANC